MITGRRWRDVVQHRSEKMTSNFGAGNGSIRGYFDGDFQCGCHIFRAHVGVSENSVPLNPMVLLIIIPIKWL